MAVETVSAYRTTDGNLFTDRSEAEAHEARRAFLAWCGDNICRGGEWSSDMVAAAILAHWDVRPKAGR